MPIQSEHPKLSLQQIEQWEVNNIPIPQPYKDFLLKHNGGEITGDKNIFDIPKIKNSSIIRDFFGIYDGLHSLDNIMDAYTKRKRFPEKYFAIGSDMLGNLILMGQSEKNLGQLFFWDHEDEVDDDEKPHEKNIYKVAKDLKTFIAKLYEDEDEDDSFGPINKLYNGSDEDIKNLLENDDWDVNTPDEIEQTLIMRAAARNKIWLAKELINRNADLSSTLEWAMFHKNKHLEMMELLLKAGADTEERNSSGHTPLQDAIIENKPEFVALLLKYGADKNVTDRFDRTPLDVAIMKNKAIDVDNSIINMDEIIKLLAEFP